MTHRQTLIQLTAKSLDRRQIVTVDEHRINSLAESLARHQGGSLWDWWLETDMSTRSWKMFCAAVIKQINDRRRQRPFEDLIVLDNSTARSGPKWW